MIRINKIVSSILTPKTGYCYNLLKENPEREIIKKRLRKFLENERRKVSKIYNSKGKLIEYRKDGRHLDIEA